MCDRIAEHLCLAVGHRNQSAVRRYSNSVRDGGAGEAVRERTCWPVIPLAAPWATISAETARMPGSSGGRPRYAGLFSSRYWRQNMSQHQRGCQSLGHERPDQRPEAKLQGGHEVIRPLPVSCPA